MSHGELDRLRDRTREFIDETVVPREAELTGQHDPDEAMRGDLQRRACDAGVFAPHVPRRWGGLGLDMSEQAAIFEEAGRSLLGPLALNCAAPDEGNTHLLAKVASAAQQAQYLAPLARGEVRSCFAMTEPAPGAGADPRALRTEATQVGDGWVIDGRKWFITGADGAAFAIVMARTGVDEATMFLVDAGNPGMRVVRRIGSLDSSFVGGHCEIVFDRCEVAADAVLGAAGAGLAYAQLRLAPGRLTHCMRWLGIAARAQEIAAGYAAWRSMFGSVLGELGLAQQLIADNEIDLEASRALVRQTAEVLDQGRPGRHETSVTKTFVSEAVGRVVDRAVQLCGAAGVSDDLPLAGFLREARPFRIYDGPSEVHRWAIARRVIRRQQATAGPLTGEFPLDVEESA